jgi:hypothetical protein
VAYAPALPNVDAEEVSVIGRQIALRGAVHAGRVGWQVAQDYPGEDVAGAQLLAADQSALAGPRGSQVRHQCGKTTAARTVVVQMLLPKLLPSASLSESVVFVSDFRASYRVWEVAH